MCECDWGECGLSVMGNRGWQGLRGQTLDVDRRSIESLWVLEQRMDLMRNIEPFGPGTQGEGVRQAPVHCDSSASFLYHSGPKIYSQ